MKQAGISFIRKEIVDVTTANSNQIKLNEYNEVIHDSVISTSQADVKMATKQSCKKG